MKMARHVRLKMMSLLFPCALRLDDGAAGIQGTHCHHSNNGTKHSFFATPFCFVFFVIYIFLIIMSGFGLNVFLFNFSSF